MNKHSIFEKTKFSSIFAAIFLGVLLTTSAAGQKKTVNYYAHLKTEHAAVVRNYIGNQKFLRSAQISGCKNNYGLKSFRQSAGTGAHPFYASADFNRDAISDFAVVLYEAKKKADATFTVLIFDGLKSGGYKFAYKSVDPDLRRGGIWTYGFDPDAEKAILTAGVFETDDCIRFEWDGAKYLE